MSFTSIVMSYKENCKAEGEIMTKFKIARGYYSNKHCQKDIAVKIGCHKNTINNIIKLCRERGPDDEIWEYLKEKDLISVDKLNSVFGFLKAKSKRPSKCRLRLDEDSNEEKLIIEKFNDCKYGYKRMFGHLKKTRA